MDSLPNLLEHTMTSGNFTSFAVESISINRDRRQRSKVEDIDELAASIARTGLINPIVVTSDGELVAGERRLTAVRELGWTHIPVQFAEDLDPLQLHLIELEENTRRKDLDWRDQCKAVADYHALRGKLEGKAWTAADTAEALGLSPASISNYLAVSAELTSNNTAVLEAPKYSVARGIVQRKQERAKATALESLAPEPTKKKASVPIKLADFNEWAKSTQTKFNFIHCDFPYGINADKHDQGNSSARGGYADSADIYYALLDTLCNNLDNFCAESAHLMFWFSMEYYHKTKTRLESAGFKVLAHPLIWHKSDNSGILPDARRQPRRVYETALLCSRGDRHLASTVSNCFASPNVKTIHMSEKPLPVLQHFFRMFVDEYSLVLDPTCGSANALKAAKLAGAKKVLGLERDPEFYKAAKEAWDA